MWALNDDFVTILTLVKAGCWSEDFLPVLFSGLAQCVCVPDMEFDLICRLLVRQIARYSQGKSSNRKQNLAAR